MVQEVEAEAWARRVRNLSDREPIEQAAAYAHLRRLILRCLGARRVRSLGDDLEDFIQDRIIDLATGKLVVKSYRTFEPFVGRVVRTRFIDRMRQTGRRREWLREVVDLTRFIGMDHAAPASSDPALRKRVRRAFRELDAESAVIVELRRIKGWTLKQTAGQLGMSITKVHQREKQAIARLHSQLEDLLE